MLKNYYTIFISSSQAGRSRQLSCHKSTLYISIFLLLLFLVGDGIAIFKYYESAHLRKENSKLKTENEKLEKIANIVDEIEKEESFIRDFLGLEKSGSNMGGLGQGGIDLYSPDISLNFPLDVTPMVSHTSFQHQQSPIEKALCLKKNLEGIVVLPVEADEYWISSGFGWRKSPFTGRREFHSGLDISSRRGTPIIAPADGTVISVGKDRYLGKYIKIAHSDTLTTLYGHLLEHKVKKGEAVKRGAIIGLMGNTGLSTGHHLHYGVQVDKKSVNPNHYILNTSPSQTILAKR
jgi:murein DD-endopeptidase MepM/ murein hydrolase activator NlpD